MTKLELIKVDEEGIPRFMGISRDTLNSPSVKFEDCVLCRMMTNIPEELPLDQRLTYVVGVGDMCSGCYLDFHAPYKEKRKRTKDINYFKFLDDFRREGGNKSWD